MYVDIISPLGPRIQVTGSPQVLQNTQVYSAALQVSIRSLLDLNPASTLAVYGNDEANLRTGLETLMAVLNSGSRQGASAEVTRYTLGLMVLERRSIWMTSVSVAVLLSSVCRCLRRKTAPLIFLQE
ncbi:hypothetical protein CRX72_15515 [Pantoea sp. BRM17]|nr:hypothetical protein CRX72_15515 [Pantoea sp. BRM17]